MIVDLHVHSSISPCSGLAIRDILAHARARGLDGVCITDHDTMDARFEVKEGVQADGLVVIVGMEYATPQGDFLLFGPFEDLIPGLPAREVLQLVARIGGAAVAAHPCRSLRPVSEEIVAQGLPMCVEVVNGRNTLEENRLASTWPQRHGLAATAGSDAHTLAELGCAPTNFSVPILDRWDLIEALRQARCAPAITGRTPMSVNSRIAACF